MQQFGGADAIEKIDAEFATSNGCPPNPATHRQQMYRHAAANTWCVYHTLIIQHRGKQYGEGTWFNSRIPSRPSSTNEDSDGRKLNKLNSSFDLRFDSLDRSFLDRSVATHFPSGSRGSTVARRGSTESSRSPCQRFPRTKEQKGAQAYDTTQGRTDPRPCHAKTEVTHPVMQRRQA